VKPRLLILSLDPAEGDPQNADGRTVEGHNWELKESQEMKKGGLKPNTHWFKTAQTAVWIFHVIKTKQLSKWVWDSTRRDEFPAVAPYWAHTNSGKYSGREIGILDPDIIVTQGIHAREAVEAAIDWKELKVTRRKQSYETGSCHLLIIAGHPVLWIVMPHPNAQNNLWYGQIEERSPYWATRITRFEAQRAAA
jgi:hypothetical protein